MGLSNISYTITSGQIGGGFPIDLSYGTIELFDDDKRSHDSQLVVCLTSISSGSTSCLTSGVEYTVDASLTNVEMQTASGLEEGDIVIIQRETQNTSRIVEFVNSAALSAEDLNTSAQQNFFLAQETTDATDNVISADSADRWDGQSKNSVNFPEPTTSTSLANKSYVDAAVAGLDPATIDNASQWDFLGSDLSTDTFDMTPGNATIGGELPDGMDFGQFLVDVAGVVYKGVTTLTAGRQYTVTDLVVGYRIEFDTGDVTGAEVVTVAAISGTINTTVGDGTITTDSITSSAVTEPKIATDAVTTDKIAADAVTADKIPDGSLTSAELATDSVTADQIATDAVGSDEIAAGAVGEAELGSGAVTAAKIGGGQVGTTALANDAVTSAKIIADAVGSSEIAAGAVGSSEIATDAVGNAELGTDAVDTINILDGSVTAAKLDTGVAGLNFDTFIEPTTTMAALDVTPTLTHWTGIINGNPSSGTQVTTGTFLTSLQAMDQNSQTDQAFRNETDQVLFVFGTADGGGDEVQVDYRNENWDAEFEVLDYGVGAKAVNFVLPPGFSFRLHRGSNSNLSAINVHAVVLK